MHNRSMLCYDGLGNPSNQKTSINGVFFTVLIVISGVLIRGSPLSVVLHAHPYKLLRGGALPQSPSPLLSMTKQLNSRGITPTNC